MVAFIFDATKIPPLDAWEGGDVLAGALALASRGWPVFPCKGNKAPATLHGFKDASTDHADIKEMFARAGASLIGIPTGVASGLVAVDVDTHGESDGTAWYEENIDALPPTLRHGTLNGGCHLIFKAPIDVAIKNSTGLLAKGVDVRGEGGYIIAPPSSGYEILEDLPAADMPEWLKKACLKDKTQEQAVAAPQTGSEDRASKYATSALDGECGAVMRAPEGGRNHQLNVSAVKLGSLVAGGLLSRSTVEGALTQAGLAAGLEPSETAATIRSGIEHGLKSPRVAPERQLTSRTQSPIDTSTLSRRPGLAPLIYAADMSPRLLAGGTLIKGLLDEGAMSVIYAPSNVGKSFLVLDIAFHIATAQPWRGFKIKKPGAVLYIAAEGGYGFVNRVVALKRHHGLADEAHVPLAVLPCSVDLLDPSADREAVVSLIEEAAERLGEPVSMVVLDTLSRLIAGGDENGPKDMTAFVANVDYIRSVSKAHCCVVHHAGKDVAKGARGHSSLRAATDTEIELARIGEGEDKTFTVSVKKQREMAGDNVYRCTLKSVLLGYDEDGEAVTSAVVEHMETPVSSVTGRRAMTDMPKLRLDALRALVEKGGGIIKAAGAPPHKVVTLDAWRDALIDGSLIDGETVDAQRMQFNRTRDAFLKKGAIAIWKKQVWPTDER